MVELKKAFLVEFLIGGFQISTTKAQSFHVPKISCVKLLQYSVQCSVKIWLYVIIMSHRSVRVNPHSIICLNVKKVRRLIWSLSDSNGIQNHSHLVRKRTLNHWGWGFVYEISGCGFESHSCLLESILGPLLFNVYLSDLFYLDKSVILQTIQPFMHVIKKFRFSY